MFKPIPALLETVENNEVAETIQKGCMDSGRLNSDLNSNHLQKSIFMISVVDPSGKDPVSEQLKDNHGEQFHSDADKEVVDYLTTVEKIDLTNSPVHNPYSTPELDGFPITGKSMKHPMLKPGGRLPKQEKDPVQVKQERKERRKAGLKRSVQEALDIVKGCGVMSMPISKKKKKEAKKSLSQNEIFLIALDEKP